MPVYEFECPKCKTVFAETRPVSKAGAPAKCPKDQTKARRIYGAAVVVGQGDSWDAGGDGGGFGGDDEFGGSEVGGMDEFGGMGGHSHGPGGHMH